MQRPVEIFHILTTPSESLVIVIPSFACKVMDLIEAEVTGTGSRLVMIWSTDKVQICQNLIAPSSDAEIREEGEKNIREVML